MLIGIKLIISQKILFEVFMTTTSMVIEVGGNRFQLYYDSDPIGKTSQVHQEKRLKIIFKCLYDRGIWQKILETSEL